MQYVVGQIHEKQGKNNNDKQFFIPILTAALLPGIFAHVNLRKKIGKNQKRCLRLVLDDYESDYGNSIKKTPTTTMEIRRL